MKKPSRANPSRNRQGAVAPCCLICGCTECDACEGGCSWVAIDYREGEGVCTACVDIARRGRYFRGEIMRVRGIAQARKLLAGS